MKLEKVLQKKFGFSSFREGQKEIIEDVLSGRNVLAMLPTGAGKSLCYQFPSYVLEGTVLVVSPLLSLMQDQVQQLKTKGEKRVVALNSFLSFEERKLALRSLHKYRIIYASPEILQSEHVLKRLEHVKISLFVVDEAHCISQWGHEFRTDYLKLTDVIQRCGTPPVLALTATASNEVQQDILRQLKLESVSCHIHSVDRNNIALDIRYVDSMQEKIEYTKNLIKQLQGSGIIYTPTRSTAEQYASILRNEGIRCAYYHGGMINEERILIQQQFINDQLDVICATNAFGMGIDKQDIRFVIHVHYPSDIESYIQEIGRAGRDGNHSVSILLYSDGDHELPERLIEKEFPSMSEVKALLNYMKQDVCKSWHDVEVVATHMGLTDIQIRFLKYQFEQFNILVADEVTNSWHNIEVEEKIRPIINKRINDKREKLSTIRLLLQLNSCRRKYLLEHFDEELQKKPNLCCDQCGFTLNELPTQQVDHLEWQFTGWENELANIFHI
ncbi:RecQ family ATP-dependent DNA helicase [Bacillus solimangrovi]|uniref:ATP-dependent DNA helicase RecQ n=1 Tax=Bacillus solimangrovi TaxID=1305675 RepID=A0A1E5LHE5_9BACI|nr:ATP-dependent DNA helicase RecQ [Bacillus solimangrovi]OEH93504.1 hypothetical protein BFG57_00480 [Bacillus solimangrovi]